MGRRLRFTKEERDTFTVGTSVEWRNGGHWHPGTVTASATRNEDGYWHVMVTNHATTRTVSKGELITSSPGAVRLPV